MPDACFAVASCDCCSRSCLGLLGQLHGSLTALIFVNLLELHCRFTTFLASITNVTCEDM